MSIWAYCEEDKEPLPGITLVSVGEFPLGPLVYKNRAIDYICLLFHLYMYICPLYVNLGDETARFKKMLRDILFWALQNPVPYPRTTVPSLMVISNISRNIEFAHVLQRLSSRGYNVLLTVPDEKEYICSVWLYPSLIESRTKFPICTRSDKSLHGKILSPSLLFTFLDFVL